MTLYIEHSVYKFQELLQISALFANNYYLRTFIRSHDPVYNKTLIYFREKTSILPYNCNL